MKVFTQSLIFFEKLIYKFIVKRVVVSDKPYKKSSQTGPQFIIKDSKDFEKEKARLIAYIKKTQQLGEANFSGKELTEFGVLTSTEWNNLFSKQLDHHLSQFGV